MWDKGPRMIRRRYFPGAQRLRNTKISASAKLAGTPLGGIHARAWNAVNCGVAGPVRVVSDAGWHLSGMGGWRALRTKVDAFSHVEMKGACYYESEQDFENIYLGGTEAVDIRELPDFVQRHRAQFGVV